LGAGACPDTGNVTGLCADPIYTFTQNGSYSLSLDPGTWVVDGFYENAAAGGVFIGSPDVVTITSGETLVVNSTVPYSKPATLDATVTVVGLPGGTQLQDVSLVLCPAGVAYSGGSTPITCVGGGSSAPIAGSTGTFSMTGLPQGSWTAYPGYCTEFGCATAQAGVAVSLKPGRTTHVHLAMGYKVPPNGMLVASVDVYGAPPGFDDAVGVTACQITLSFSSCDETEGTAGFPLSMELGDGVWEITGEYFAPVFGNPISGPPQFVVIQGGQTLTLTEDVPYQVLGTAAGSIKVAGLPGGVKVTSYTVTACPADVSILNLFLPFSCVTEYSGPGGENYFSSTDAGLRGRSESRAKAPRASGVGINSYSLPTLTPGQWSLSVGYTTAFGSFFAPESTTVDVLAGHTTTTKLTTPYQAPTVGAVTGSVSVTGAPEESFSAGAMACSAPPTLGTCADEVDASLGANGQYALDLAPGTWWVSGVVYVYGFTTNQEFTSAPRQVTVSIGTQTRANFTVAVG
jgi:hypothetical protein